MRSLSKVVKDKKVIDTVQLYQFFSDFALEEETEEAAAETEEEIDEAERERLEEEERRRQEEQAERERASEILEQARREAEQILREAKERVEVLKEEAWESGKQDGYQAGFAQGKEEYRIQFEEEVQDFQKHASEFMDSIRLEKNAVLEKYLDDLKRIVLAIAEKVIHTSLKSSEDIIHRMILSATDKLKKTEWAKIYITKCGTEISMNTDVDFLNALSHLSDNVKIVAMDNDEEGICIIELPDEIIDASVSTQLENIKDILNNARI